MKSSGIIGKREKLNEIAKKRGIVVFEASVLSNNVHMLSVFYNSGYKISTKREDNIYEMSYDIRDKLKE